MNTKLTKTLAYTALSIASLFALPALAYDDADKAQIEEKIAIIDASIESGDFKTIGSVYAP